MKKNNDDVCIVTANTVQCSSSRSDIGVEDDITMRKHGKQSKTLPLLTFFRWSTVSAWHRRNNTGTGM